MALVVHPELPQIDAAPDVESLLGDLRSEEWRSFSLDDLLGVAGFLAGNVLAHRADPDVCAQELLDWTDGRADAIAAAARSIEGDAEQQHTLNLLRRAFARAAVAA